MDFGTLGLGFLAGGPIGMGMAGQWMAGRDMAEAQQQAAMMQYMQAQQDREFGGALAFNTGSYGDLNKLAFMYGRNHPAFDSIIRMAESGGLYDTQKSLQNQVDAESRAIEMAQFSLDRSKKLMTSLDPNIKAAYDQSYSLLTGNDTELFKPIQAQRKIQRDAMLASLKRQGLDETSTPALQALAGFDTAEQGQRTGLASQLMNLAGVGVSQGSAIQGDASQANRDAQSSIGLTYAMRRKPFEDAANAMTRNPVTQYAGAQYVGDIGRAQATSNLFGNMNQMFMSGLGAYMGGMGGQPQPQHYKYT